MYVLFGPPGVGKSTLGLRLAQALNLPFFDIDQMISPTPHLVWKEQGEEKYRGLEADIVSQLEPGGVVACGGSTIFNHLEELSNLGRLYYLHCPIDLLIERYFSKPRAMVSTPEELRAMLEIRLPAYEAIEAIPIDTSRSTIKQWNDIPLCDKLA